MSSQDLPACILEQDDDLTRLADDCELVQHLVADAERAWEEKLDSVRRRGEPESGDSAGA